MSVMQWILIGMCAFVAAAALLMLVRESGQ